MWWIDCSDGFPDRRFISDNQSRDASRRGSADGGRLLVCCWLSVWIDGSFPVFSWMTFLVGFFPDWFMEGWFFVYLILSVAACLSLSAILR